MSRPMLDLDNDTVIGGEPEAPAPRPPRQVFAPEAPSRKSELATLAMHSSKSQEHYTPMDLVERARKLMGDIDLDPASSWLAQERIKAKSWYGWIREKVMVNGLLRDWSGKVFVNPPGGDTSRCAPELSGLSKSYAAIWWAKLVAEYRAGRVEQAVFIGFSLELLVSIQGVSTAHPLQFPICIPSSRIPFDYPTLTENGRPIAEASAEQPEIATCQACQGAKLNPLSGSTCFPCQGTGVISVLAGERLAEHTRIAASNAPAHGNFIVWLPPAGSASTAAMRACFGDVGVVPG